PICAQSGACAAASYPPDSPKRAVELPIPRTSCLNSPHIFATVNQIKIIYLLGLAFAGFLMLNKRKT
ncbi:hypothetical protein ACRCPA_30875, partial [Pseudomonas aeruginosa]